MNQTEYQAHLNWIRCHCLDLAVARNRMGNTEKILEEARIFDSYILGSKPAEVISLVK
jgi:hypothetical protein